MLRNIKRLELEYVENYKYRTLTGLYIYLDSYIIKNNALNRYYYIKLNDKNIKQRIFLTIQQEYIETITFNEGSVFQLKNKLTEDCFILTANKDKNIKKALLRLYELAHTENDKEIYNIISQHKYTDFELTIIN